MISNKIGQVYKDKGDLDNALQFYTKSLDIIKEIFANDSYQRASVLNNIGGVYKDKGDLD